MMQLDIIAEFIRNVLSPVREFLQLYVPTEWIMSLPAITLVAFGLISLVVGMRYNPLAVSFLGVVVATLQMILFEPIVLSGYSFGTLFVRDAFTDFFIYIVLIVAFLVLMSSTLWGGDKGTYNFLLMISFAGALWVVMATDLVALFLAWEVMSTPTYVLVALSPRREAVDGATKYFVIGLLATMLMLFGIALTYGVAGTTDLSALSAYVNTVWSSPTGNEPAAYTLLLAMVLFIVSFGFKVGIFPGWQWVPDAYASADGNVTAYLAGGSKKTGVSALLRILMIGFFFAKTEWAPLIAGVAILTMVIGNVLALAQKDIMRMLAYSSIAMMGYLFIGVAAGNEIGLAAAGFHAFTHAIMKTAAFILIWTMSYKLTKRITYDDLAGLSRRAPVASAMFAILMLSLAGMPLTVGFWSKLVLFQSAVVANMWWLALIGLLNSVFSLGYYLRVLKYTYMEEPKDESKLTLPIIPMIAAAICVVAVIALFIFPNVILDYAFAAAQTFFP
ncbi:NADH-quinone oxidoreductase subunit N [Candidatus Thorarchaeota archaeon]|nr:MAG: NADH-quinone oxidoreductase subunit N [Candidatus Thorarchaeota archaeon]